MPPQTTGWLPRGRGQETGGGVELQGEAVDGETPKDVEQTGWRSRGEEGEIGR